eukprot:4075365-Amphidinium_carterae.1
MEKLFFTKHQREGRNPQLGDWEGKWKFKNCSTFRAFGAMDLLRPEVQTGHQLVIDALHPNLFQRMRSRSLPPLTVFLDPSSQTMKHLWMIYP